jgi:hypothetical protein
MSSPAPVALFVYNRPAHTTRALSALARCPEAGATNLTVFSDGPREDPQGASVEETRAVVRSARGFRSCETIQRERNLGLSRNIVDGVTRVLAGSDRVVVLEDDIEVQPEFLTFMNAALDYYRDAANVWSISGYLYPVDLPDSLLADAFLYRRFSCWGWATWADRWRRIDWTVPSRTEFMGNRGLFRRFSAAANDLPEMMLDRIDGLNDSWSIVFAYTQVREDGYSVHPVRTLARNAGFDGSGTHATANSRFVQAALGGFAGRREFRFADAYDSSLTRPLDAYFAHRTRRKLKNLVRYGRWF